MGRRLVLLATLGLALGTAASWLRAGIAGTLRIDTGTPLFAGASLLLGLGLALASLAAVRLYRLAPSLPRGWMLRWSLAPQLALLAALPLTSSDFFQYVAYGVLQRQGQNPLAVGPSALGRGPLLDVLSKTWANQPSVYGPVLNLLFAASAWVGGLFGPQPWTSAAVLKVLMVASGIATLAAAERFLRTRPGADGSQALAMIAFCPLLAWEVSGQGHGDGVLALAMMLFVQAALARRDAAATLWLAAGLCAKISFAPVLALWLFFLWRDRGLRSALACAALSAALGGLLLLPYLRGFSGLGPMMQAVRSTRSHSLGDLLAIAVTPLGPLAQERVLRASFVLCVAVCAAAMTWAAASARTVPQMLRGALVFLLAWDLTVPLFQSWYIVWLLPLAIADEDPRWTRLVGLYAIWSVLQWAVQLDPLTTVAIDGWVAFSAVRLLRTARAPLEVAPG